MSTSTSSVPAHHPTPPPTYTATDPLSPIKALTFDVFGTCVDWRSSIEAALADAAAVKLASPAFANEAPPAALERLRAMTASDWAVLAQAWRDSYWKFTRGYVPGNGGGGDGSGGDDSEWRDVDAHHRDSLAELLEQWGLGGGMFSGAEVEALSQAWHALRPWDDTAEGLRRLGGTFVTSSLSNGNTALLRDLDAHAGLGFRRLLSAEDFRAYKPHPSVYRGACDALGCRPAEVAMVAAHLGDLAAARSCGLRTIYVERPREEAWEVDEGRYREARGWVDLWVADGDGGFLEVARRLGVS